MQELGLRDPEGEGTAISLNVRNYPPHDTALYPTRLEYFVLDLFATFDKEVRRGEADSVSASFCECPAVDDISVTRVGHCE